MRVYVYKNITMGNWFSKNEEKKEVHEKVIIHGDANVSMHDQVQYGLFIIVFFLLAILYGALAWRFYQIRKTKTAKLKEKCEAQSKELFELRSLLIQNAKQ